MQVPSGVMQGQMQTDCTAEEQKLGLGHQKTWQRWNVAHQVHGLLILTLYACYAASRFAFGSAIRSRSVFHSMLGA